MLSTDIQLTFYFSFQPVLHDWCNKGRGMWDDAYKITLAANRKE